jgi:hypothetical protein
MLSSNEANMNAASTIKYVVAGATLLTNVAIAGGLVWSIATGKPVILPVTLGMLGAGFGYFSYRDYLYFFGKK